MSDWLTTAINSVRGSAIEALLNLALAQTNNPESTKADPWIFDLLADRLQRAEESEAVFAICGARLRLIVHLFREEIVSRPELFLPPDHLGKATALVTSHVLYDNPSPAIVATFPAMPSAALEFMPIAIQQRDQHRNWNDYESRLGTHLAFYFWNNSYGSQEEAEQTIDRYFASASEKGRAATIAEIGRIFGQIEPNQKDAALYERVMALWDRRFSHIQAGRKDDAASKESFAQELGQFTSWIKSKCFPFAWRFSRVTDAFRLLNEAPRVHLLIETLEEIASGEKRIDEVMILLHELISKPSADFRWEFYGGRLKGLLELGFTAEHFYSRKLAQEIQEMLLQQGSFEYLDLEPSPQNRD